MYVRKSFAMNIHLAINSLGRTNVRKSQRMLVIQKKHLPNSYGNLMDLIDVQYFLVYL